MTTSSVRFQIDLTPEELELFERLSVVCGIRTKRELVTNALSLFRWAVKEVRNGRSICSVTDSGEHRWLEMPALAHAAEDYPLLTKEEMLAAMAKPTGSLSQILPRNQGSPHDEQTVDGRLDSE